MPHNNPIPDQSSSTSTNRRRRRLLAVLIMLIIIAGLGAVTFPGVFASPLPANQTTTVSMVPTTASTRQAIQLNLKSHSASTPTVAVSPTSTIDASATQTAVANSTQTVVTDATQTAVAIANTPPSTLKHRPEGTTIAAAGGKYEAPFKGSLGGTWLMFYRGDSIVLKGQGYFRIRWEVAWFNRTTAQIVMPTWTDQSGTFLHVADGGGHRMDDLNPSPTEPGETWMGEPSRGFDTLPPGTPMIWQNQYYYLDGTVTLHENEGTADYNLSATPVTWSNVTTDINTRPTGTGGSVRYGVCYDPA